MMKRLFDIVVAFAGLLLLAPLFLLVALVIKLDSPGPVFFRQERMGKGFRPFFIYKFRTMVQDASRMGRAITSSTDPRITRVGRILRKTKVDEFPQLINVLRGEMSFVGPRPEVREYVELFRRDYEEIVKVAPGITDLASIQYRYEAEILGNSGNPEEAEICARMCLKLSPVDPELRTYYFQLMQATLGQRHFEEAFEHLTRCLNAQPHDTALLGFKAVLLGHLGRRAEAETCLAEYLSKRKLKSVDDYRRIFVPNSTLFEINLEGLRKAGWDV